METAEATDAANANRATRNKPIFTEFNARITDWVGHVVIFSSRIHYIRINCKPSRKNEGPARASSHCPSMGPKGR